MVTKRPMSWFLTEQGRKFSYAVITGTGIAVTVAKYVPQTIFLNKYREFVQYYNNGKPVDLTQELNNRFQECLNILKLSDVHKKIISPFSAYGYDLFHAGSCSSRFGVAVGIPVNFGYKTLDDLKNQDIQVNQKKIDWLSETAKKLANALILPEKVQQFAICREILMTQNNKIIFDSLYPFLSLFFSYNLSYYLNNRLKLYSAPLILRSTLYLITSTFGLGIYFFLKDSTQVYYESQIDKKLCELGPDFIESGVIFYSKLLERNQALRELMGKEGEKTYSKLGNEQYNLRHPHIDLVHRKQFFEERLKEIKNET